MFSSAGGPRTDNTSVRSRTCYQLSHPGSPRGSHNPRSSTGGIFSQLIDKLPIRIQRFRMRLMRFKFTICHVPGKHLNTADALSRAPLVEPVGDLQANDLCREIEVYVNAVLVCLPASDKHLDEFHRALKEDDTLQDVTYHVEHGWPNSRCEVSGPLVKYWTERGKLTLLEGLLFRGKQIVAPADLREDVLRHLHDGHQGVTKTWANASSSVWWPGMSKDIENAIRNCAVCENFISEVPSVER